MEKIDAHCHFWSLARGDYGWLAAGGAALDPIRRDFAPDELAAQNGAARVVVVQAAPTDAETDYLLALAGLHPRIAGVVGWVDLGAASAAARIAGLAAQPAFKGVRPMLQDETDDDWINRAPRPDAIAALIAHGLRFDALVVPRQLAPLQHFAARWPDLPIVIDHAAKPRLTQGGPDAVWERGMQALARDPRIYCKLSGLLTEMSPPQRASPDAALATLRPIMRNLLDWFGPDRLVWGSDWPVLTLAASHADWLGLSERLLDTLSQAERAAIFGGNARRFYGLGEP